MDKELNCLLNSNAELLRNSIKAIAYLRVQNFYNGLKFVKTVLDQIETLMNNYLVSMKKNGDLELNVNYLNEMLMELLQAQIDRDYILLADLYELKLNPFILELQQCIMNNTEPYLNYEKYKESIDKLYNDMNNKDAVSVECYDIKKLLHENYFIEHTCGGVPTLAISKNGRKIYIHSNGIITKEAWNIAKEWYLEKKLEYVIYGLGLGYHILELLEIDDTLEVTVYESDINIIHLACAYGCMDALLKHSKRFKLIYDYDFSRLKTSLENLKKDAGHYIYYPSMGNIDDKMARESMEEYFVSYSSVINQRNQLFSNFKKNILNYDGYIDSLKEKFINKDLYIIAAGPSLDKNFLLLKNISKNGIILATGTVLKKIIKADILPDYVIITDGNIGAYNQINDLNANIPLLFLSTVNHKVTNTYLGKKYLICQEGFEPAERLAKVNKYSLYQTGGSVTTTALEVGIQMGCKRIIFLGLDLAYTDNLNHASDTLEYGIIDMPDYRTVEDINGKMIKTGKNLDIYRKWIENRVKSVKNIEFIDATEGGAKIKGMKIDKLINYLG